MVNVEKHIAYWANGAREDWEVAQELLKHGHPSQSLFFAHLALEKALKAHVTRHTSDIAPRIHNLVELAARAGLALDKRERNILQKTNKFNIRGRYGGPSRRPLVMREAKLCIAQSEEVFQWLLEQL